jgi:hypothetical protein
VLLWKIFFCSPGVVFGDGVVVVSVSPLRGGLYFLLMFIRYFFLIVCILGVFGYFVDAQDMYNCYLIL